MRTALVAVLLGLLIFGCSQEESGTTDDGILRSKDPTYGDATQPTPRAERATIQRQLNSTLSGAEKKPHHTLYGHPRETSSLGPGDPVPNTGLSTLRRALATRLPLSPSDLEPGCADGTREGFISLPMFPDIAACAGGDMGLTHIDSPEANAHCSPGWHVCSPARDAADAAIVGSITYLEATLPDGCFAYNAAQNGDACIACTGDPGARQMAGVGKDCIGGTYNPAGSGCTADGRVDSYDAEGTMGLACGGTLADGVVCCSSGAGAGSTPADCPSFAPGPDDIRLVNDCTDFCGVGPGSCDEPNWPDGYPVQCARDGFEWACLAGATCDTTTPIDFYIMLYTPETYCIFDPDTCPPDFPDPCGGVCCRSGATCLAGAHCLDICPPDHPAECHTDGLFSGCCLDDLACGFGCACSLPMRPCGDYCCPNGQVCRDGVCHSRDCDTNSDHPGQCQDLCCLLGVDCHSTTPPGVCGCPPDLPVECGDFCCSSDSICDNGVCTSACTGDHPVECPTQTQGLICCLAGASCEADDCTCPPELPVECADYCASPDAVEMDGDCYLVECPGGWEDCGNLCCDPPSTCAQLNDCTCPPGFSVPCDLMCCKDGGTCDPGGCTGGCTGDFPVDCPNGPFGPECCPQGIACGDNGCNCPADHPVQCDEGCCPAGTICNGDNCQEISCYPDYPIDCGRICCLPGAECLAQNECTCPDNLPVTCGPYCCPEGLVCDENFQCKKPPKPDGDTCSSNSDCTAFGSRNCQNLYRCDTTGDHLCHCCMPYCQGSSCNCQPCANCVNDPNTKCVDGVCVFKLGGTPSD